MSYTPTPGSKSASLINALREAGRAMRTQELSDVTGVPAENVHGLLDTAVKHGAVTCCKIEIVGNKRAIKEYRIGPGMPSKIDRQEYKPQKQTILPVRPPEAPIVDKPWPPRITPEPDMVIPPPLTLGEKLKRAINPPRPDPIMPPSARRHPATGKLGFTIDDGGTLTIYLNDGMSDPLTLDNDETLALGDFLHATTGIWRP